MTPTGEFPAIVANVNAVTVVFATEAANVTLQNPAETKGLFEARVVLVYQFLPTGLADVVSPHWHCFIPPQEWVFAYSTARLLVHTPIPDLVLRLSIEVRHWYRYTGLAFSCGVTDITQTLPFSSELGSLGT